MDPRGDRRRGRLAGGGPVLLSPVSVAFGVVPGLLPLLGGLSLGVFAQAYRYRRVATAVQRQQSKWDVGPANERFYSGP